MKIESNRKDAEDAKKNKRSFWIILCVLRAFAVNDFKYLRYLQGAPCAPGLYSKEADEAKNNQRFIWITLCVLRTFAVNDFKYLRYL